jgi:hypothetical protein
MRWMEISRRGLLAGAASLALARPATATTTRLVSAARGTDGVDRAVAVDGDGRLLFSVALPGRGHAAAPTPDGTGLVMVARRPGTWLALLDLADGRWRRQARLPSGRHVYGHAVYGPAGRLYVCENDIDSGEGRIAVYDAALTRIADFASGGIGPHQLLFADGALVVGNGGNVTHPASGREVLNLADMKPNLSWLDPADGRVLRQVALPPRWHQLSLRHLAPVGDGRIAVAGQHQGPASERPPLLAIADADGLHPVEVPDTVSRRWRNYAGSVAVDVSGTFAAVSHPRGGLVTFYRLDRPAYLGMWAIPDACGVAPAPAAGRFWISDGFGGLRQADAATGQIKRVAALTLAWDNHLTVA